MNERKLKAKCIEMGVGIDELCLKIGINTSSFYRKMKNDTFTCREARIITEVLELTENETMLIFFSQSVSDVRI